MRLPAGWRALACALLAAPWWAWHSAMPAPCGSPPTASATHSPVVLATLAEGELFRLHWQTTPEQPPDEPSRDVPAFSECIHPRRPCARGPRGPARPAGARMRGADRDKSHRGAAPAPRRDGRVGPSSAGRPPRRRPRSAESRGLGRRAKRDSAVPVVAWLDEERQCVGRRNRLREAGVTIGTFKNVTSIESALASELPVARLEELLDIHEPMSSRVGESRRQQPSTPIARRRRESQPATS
jgi:hypothetical protein